MNLRITVKDRKQIDSCWYDHAVSVVVIILCSMIISCDHVEALIGHWKIQTLT